MFFTPTAYYQTTPPAATLPPGYLPADSVTKIITSQCGETLSSIYDKIEAFPVYLAAQYEFYITNGSTTIVISSNNNYIFLTQFPGRGAYNTTYEIKVRSKRAGDAATFTAWGDFCNVTTPTSAPAPFTIGDSALGGKIAYILQSGDLGYNASVQHGLVATLLDFPVTAAWGCEGTSISGADQTAIGYGNQNTVSIVAGCPTAGIAARLCSDLVESGYSDWYLPSIDELSQLYTNRVAIGGFSTSFYWSSTESDSNLAWAQYFGIFGVSDISLNDKSNSTFAVRAVRSF